MRAPKGYRVLKPVHPNAGISAEYRQKLDEVVDDMADSYRYWLTAAYRANEPVLAQDAAAAPRVTAVEMTRGWTVYVDGEILRDRKGGHRIFKTQWSAEGAGLRSTPRSANAVVTEPVGIGQRLNAAALADAPVVTTPAGNLQERLNALGAQWAKRINDIAPKLATWFRKAAGKRSDAALKKVLADGGMSVKFQPTPAMLDIAQATVSENISLIKSIGSEYHTKVEGAVMRSVVAGRDLGGLVKEIEEVLGVTRRRASFIALDQNNKMTAAMVKVRQSDLGLQAMWLHSTAGKVPRPTHLANTGKLYDPRFGWHDPDPKVNRRIWPGELPRCRCVSRSVVKGFS
jgi:Phage Mu protein F like protein